MLDNHTVILTQEAIERDKIDPDKARQQLADAKSIKVTDDITAKRKTNLEASARAAPPGRRTIAVRRRLDASLLIVFWRGCSRRLRCGRFCLRLLILLLRRHSGHDSADELWRGENAMAAIDRAAISISDPSS